ncbi:MAG: transporter [Sphingomicrobium sp.]
MKAAFLLLLMAAPAAAADPPAFCTDRPGLATGTCTAAAGTFQLESSLAEWSRSDTGRELRLGPSVLRYGFDDRTEVQLGFTPFDQVRTFGAARHRGVGDVTVAFKHRFSDPDAATSIALLPFVKLPTARDPIGNGRWEGGLLVPMQAPLAGPLSLTLTPEADWNANGDGNGHHARLSSAASLGLTLSPRWSAALDGQVGRERDGGVTAWDATVGLSAAFLATPTLQLDSEVDVGLTSGTPETTLKTGVSARF